MLVAAGIDLLLLGREGKLRRCRRRYAKGHERGQRARLGVEGEYFGCGVILRDRIVVLMRLFLRMRLRVLADLQLTLRMQCLLLLLQLLVAQFVVMVEMHRFPLLLGHLNVVAILRTGRVQPSLGWTMPLSPIVNLEQLDSRRAATSERVVQTFSGV